MENRENQNPSTGAESDISKSQSQQQPATSQDREPKKSEAEKSGDEAATGQAQSGFGETATEQRSDVEGSSLGKEPAGEAEGGFVGSEGETDTSSELVEDEDQKFRKDGPSALEGK